MSLGSNQALEPGNVSIASPYFIGGLTGILTGIAAGAVLGTLQNLGRPKLEDPSVILNVPIYVSQIRIRYSAVTSSGSLGGIAVSKVTVATQRTPGTSVLATRRAGAAQYPEIPATQVNMVVATTGGLAGGSTVQLGTLDMTDGNFGSVWTPSDLCPLILEVGQGLDFIASAPFTAGTGVALLAVDFLRQ